MKTSNLVPSLLTIENFWHMFSLSLRAVPQAQSFIWYLFRVNFVEGSILGSADLTAENRK